MKGEIVRSNFAFLVQLTEKHDKTASQTENDRSEIGTYLTPTTNIYKWKECYLSGNRIKHRA